MQLLTGKILVLMVFVIDNIQTELNPAGQNVCLKSETYEEKVSVTFRKPVNVTKKKWCWDIKKSFQCLYTSKTWKEVTELRPFNRTRIAPKCCDGYKEERESENYPTLKCSPVCLKGCKNGRCISPEICDCFSGFYGSECEKVCSEGHWGKNCFNTCDCSNNGKCDKVTGVCHCEKGWTGARCEFPCQTGYHGFMCKMKCDCGESSCDHQTGKCFPTTTTATPTTEPEAYTTRESLTTKTSLQVQPSETSEILHEDLISEVLQISKTVSEPIDSLTEHTSQEIITATDAVILATSSTITTDTKFSETTKFGKKIEETAFINLSFDTTVSHGFRSTTETVEETPTNNLDVTNEEREVMKKINENFNLPINKEVDEATEINFSGSEQGTDKVETENFIKENKGNKKAMVKISKFLPGLSVFSSVSILTFVIAAFWLINKHRNKTKMVLATPVKNNKAFQQEELIKNSSESFFWSNNCTNNPVFLSDVDVNCTIPVLETFKPLKSDKNEIRGEKEIRTSSTAAYMAPLNYYSNLLITSVFLINCIGWYTA